MEWSMQSLESGSSRNLAFFPDLAKIPPELDSFEGFGKKSAKVTPIQ